MCVCPATLGTVGVSQCWKNVSNQVTLRKGGDQVGPHHRAGHHWKRRTMRPSSAGSGDPASAHGAATGCTASARGCMRV